MKKSARLAQKPLSSLTAADDSVVPASAPWMVIASRVTPIPTSWSRALSAKSLVSYIDVNVWLVMNRTPFPELKVG